MGTSPAPLRVIGVRLGFEVVTEAGPIIGAMGQDGLAAAEVIEQADDGTPGVEVRVEADGSSLVPPQFPVEEPVARFVQRRPLWRDDGCQADNSRRRDGLRRGSWPAYQ